MQRANKGFTLVEFLVVVSIIGIMLMIAVPNFQSFMRRYELSIVTNEFLSSMSLARSEAIKRGVRVDLAPNSGGDWRTGWTIVSSGVTITTRPSLPNSFVISSTSGTTPFSDGTNVLLAFNPAGYAKLGNGESPNNRGSIIITNGSYSNLICVNILGRARVVSNATTCPD